MVPCAPTTQASSGAIDQTPLRFSVVPLGDGDHDFPSKCWMLPFNPIAHTSEGPEPVRPSEEGLLPPAVVHVLPSQCWNAP